MQHRSLLLFFSFLCLLLPAKSILAQGFFVQTTVDSLEFCPDASTAFPVKVQNMIGVDSLHLVLTYNPAVINYQTYQMLNQALAGAGSKFSITELNGSITIDWSRNTEASLINDILVVLVFYGISGNTPLTWDTITPGNCIYHSIGDSLLPAKFISGNAIVFPVMNLILDEPPGNAGKTCVGKCDASRMAGVTGGTPPYDYWWNNEVARIKELGENLCDGQNEIRIKDSKGCELDSIFEIDGMPGAKVTIKIECEQDTTTVLFRENPTLTFSFEEISPTHVVDPPLWIFGDGDSAISFNPTHEYIHANENQDNFYKLELHIKNQNGCDTIIIQRIPIKDQKLKISNVIVPSSSTAENRLFTIFDENGNLLRNEYLRLEVYIFDRWGRRLYASTDYKNDWSPSGAPDGVYYYVVNTIGRFHIDKHKGSVTIIGNSN